ncbi:MAG TPA: response regulator [Gemmataceae bacterium]|jgi:DNA-binding NtrC family response regulator|nr:response regulator [Gemmataceae bacterium]
MVATRTQYSILITDDDRGVREALSEIVESKGFRPVLAQHGEEAVEIVQHEPVHLALLDMHMPRLTGLETLQLVRQIHALLPAILITADATLDLMRQAFQAQVFSVVPKPVNRHVVINTVLRALVKVYGTVDDPPSKPEFGEPTP